MFAITNELKDPTPTRVDRVIVTAIGLALTVYVTVAVSGYSTFGGKGWAVGKGAKEVSSIESCVGAGGAPPRTPF